MTKPSKYLVIGLIANVVIFFIFCSYLLVSIALSYNGRCGVFWFFGGQGRPCPLHEYMKEELAFFIAGLFELWWLILPAAVAAFAVLPGLGYLIGRVRNSFETVSILTK